MNVGMFYKGFDAVQVMLRSIGERVPDTARGMMKRSAARTVKLAKNYVPEESGALMESIRIEKTYDVRGRLQISITAGGGDQLDQYAVLVHEAYETEVAYVNGPGARTLEKMAQFPGKVGSGFLTRAAAEEEEKLRQKLVVEISAIIRSSGGGV